ncbi:3-methyl-2-oxobutanoate hydroxymethyltransferase [Brucella pseudogrignonensis]|uniref:3-methyl-2-oxobutanoate hydroxymethyltransferase n=1 Tax=Brucella pseudogrignonensis TaxID=419475 RepID=UPI000CFB74B9|nr:3-methyl-2-oxobutanoate hydroxymethyltransferase [Brucella pseudogrignonensis]MQP39538.1 3-methyl-2-oxobutanoate hydroxymethyltransferase [Ochrobactrum sp. MYb237]PQZ42702.1 3-methyl-2-oxobutanoate hydroxymethyltransferase [Brucella pseudogrignonensis]PRA42131.1 3-methyl-2-oxobutanoate hydroxymethyltransferase [Brucella pseudogrignonensis]PRA70442.1 3-methyl-2-oxobutanoate hydroxymethyltransferase [Brucella pseudogrignonensis]
MSVTVKKKRLSPKAVQAMKGVRPIVSLTAYTTPIARLLDPHCDLLLVGDSVGMVLYGMDSTLAVTLDMMIAHGKAVMRGVEHACVTVDLPFGTYQESKEQAFRNAARIMQETGCDGVKLEGGEEMAETVEFIVKRGIPVFGHVGLMPQQVNTVGGFRSLGRDDEEANRIRRDAQAIAEAGAFALVIEGTVEPLAREITQTLLIPTIGIGASPACDGQILVSDDMLGLFQDFTPRFVKRFTELAPQVSDAAKAYAEEVRARSFPGPEHVFGVKK